MEMCFECFLCYEYLLLYFIGLSVNYEVIMRCIYMGCSICEFLYWVMDVVLCLGIGGGEYGGVECFGYLRGW